MSVLDKLAKLLNKAENASTPEEASAYMTKAQTLATQTSIDLAVARQHTAKKEQREQPTQKHVIVGEHGKKNLRAFTDLFLAVANNNELKVNIAHNATYVNLFGFPSDIEVAEALYASLVFQMVESGNAFLRSGEYKKETRRVYNDRKGAYVDKPLDGRIARANFYIGFTRAIGNRLFDARYEARQVVREQQFEVLNEAEEEVKVTGELVLKAKAEEVDEFYSKVSTARGAYTGASTSKGSYSSRSAGQSAGQNARLSAPKSIANRTAVS